MKFITRFWSKNKMFWLIFYACLITPLVLFTHGWVMGFTVGVPTGMVALGLFAHWRYYVLNKFGVMPSE